MILTCPTCETRFLLPAERLGPEGRRVKCSNCSHVWLQEPEYEDRDVQFSTPNEVVEAQSFQETLKQQSSSDLPESVQPKLADTVLPSRITTKRQSTFKQAMAGYGGAALLFFMSFGVILGARDGIAKSWPASRLFYDSIGFGVPAPGEGLAFDEVLAKAAPDESGEGEFIEIVGRIVNSAEKEQLLPPVSAMIRDGEGKIIERWIIDMPANTVGAEQAVVFNLSRKITRRANDVRVAMEFWTPKTAAAGGDSNQVQQAGDPVHQPVSGEAAESPVHASSPIHQESEH